MEEDMKAETNGKLEAWEQEIEDDFDAWQPLPPDEKAKLMAELSKASVRKPVTVRMDTRDLAALKNLAEREGLPYQTLLSSVLHKYVSGSLVDVNEARKVYLGTSAPSA
jgi:predicted DNA binding CopG/RHH family protein